MKLVKKKVHKEVTQQETQPKYTDLRQVMDYKKPFTIFFSGVEYESYLEILYHLGIRDFLMSYEYLKGKGLKQLKKYPDIRLFIDSGAYTYMNDPKYEEYTVEQWEEQVKSYLNWIEKHRSQIFAACELDLQYIVGCDAVDKWRKTYFEPFMLRTGIPICFMYHEEGMQQWEYMCKRYPYVGLSLTIDENTNESTLKDMFNVAEKYNSLVQGMASTKTSLLTQFPFYTVDSTTWNVGLKYGEISVWNKTKMGRVKKVDFQSKAFPIISTYDIKFDFDKILDEDKTEMIRVNAYAFVMAEKYIQERLKSYMYWFKSKTLKQNIENLPEDFFPPVEWFDTDTTEGLEEYCHKMNVNPEVDEAKSILYDITTFMNWNSGTHQKMVDWYNEPEQSGLIDDLHDLYVNRIVPDKETKVLDLIRFFGECISGDNDKLLQLGTNFDRTVKERDSYIEEDETELVDIPNEEVRKRLHNLLPDKSFEDSGSDITELDAEIYKQAEIVPTFDDKGKFVKGQVSVRKPKRVYSKKFPKMACDTCFAAAKCPEYKAGYVCAYNKMFERFSTRDMGDIIQSVQGIVEYNMTRMQKSMIMETLNGVIDPVTSQLMDTNIKYMQMLKQMYETGSPEVLRQTRVLKADGTEETTTSITNPQSGGIMEKLFGSMMNRQQNNDEVIEVAEVKEVDKGENNE